MADTIDRQPQPAPRARAVLAGLIDATVMALPGALLMRRTMREARSGQASARAPRWMWLLAPAFAVLEEQVGTAGGWMMGVRTVDKRTGARLALWRSLAVVLTRGGTRLLARRLTPRPVIPTDAERRRQRAELEAIKERHRNEEDARNAALMRYYSEHRVRTSSGLLPTLAAGLGSTLLNRVVRRRVAPTVVIDARAHALTARKSAQSRRA